MSDYKTAIDRTERFALKISKGLSSISNVIYSKFGIRTNSITNLQNILENKVIGRNDVISPKNIKYKYEKAFSPSKNTDSYGNWYANGFRKLIKFDKNGNTVKEKNIDQIRNPIIVHNDKIYFVDNSFAYCLDTSLNNIARVNISGFRNIGVDKNGYVYLIQYDGILKYTPRLELIKKYERKYYFENCNSLIFDDGVIISSSKESGFIKFSTDLEIEWQIDATKKMILRYDNVNNLVVGHEGRGELYLYDMQGRLVFSNTSFCNGNLGPCSDGRIIIGSSEDNGLDVTEINTRKLVGITNITKE